MITPREELEEVTALVRATHSFVENYCQVSRGTGHGEVAERARKRLREHLLNCQREAIADLHESRNTGDHMRELEKFSASLEAPIAGDEERPTRTMAPTGV